MSEGSKKRATGRKKKAECAKLSPRAVAWVREIAGRTFGALIGSVIVRMVAGLCIVLVSVLLFLPGRPLLPLTRFVRYYDLEYEELVEKYCDKDKESRERLKMYLTKEEECKELRRRLYEKEREFQELKDEIDDQRQSKNLRDSLSDLYDELHNWNYIYTTREAKTDEATKLYKDIQRVLSACKSYWGDINGIQRATYDAVVEFQRENGLQMDGIIGPETWGAVFDKLEEVRGELGSLNAYRNPWQ